MLDVLSPAILQEDHPASAPILAIEGLTTVFPTIDGDVPAVIDMSFSIRAGETVAVVGESGSGKSVTARSILRLTDYQGAKLRSGAINFRGRDGQVRDLAKLDPAQMRKIRGNDISIIFQEPLTALNPVMSVGEQIAEAIVLHQNKTYAQAMEQALKQLELARIPEAARRLAQYPHELSGGMRQRVMIAMALACRPQLLIADEPTTALDVTIQAQILSLIRALQAEIGMAVLFITHDMGVVAEIADRVVVMYQGRKVEEGPVAQVFSDPKHPYTKALLAAVPRLGAMAGKTSPEPFPRISLGHDNGQDSAPERIAPAPSIPVRAGPPLNVLEVHNLTTRFPIHSGLFKKHVANVHAVENVSFTLAERETLALVGESGCGKSTTGRTILKLVEPTSGDIIIQRRNITNYTPWLMQPVRRQVQMIFQDPFASLNPRMSVEELIAEPLLIHEMCPKSQTRDRVVDLLEQVGLRSEHLVRYPHEFSGGQRQRLCIARALSLNPAIIVADEAVSALDVSIQAQVVNLLMDLQKRYGISYLFISHDMAVVERVSHRVGVMYLGQIVEIGPRERVFANPQHPYTRKLLDSVPVADPGARRQRPMQTSEIPSPVKPVGYQPVIPPMVEVEPGHFVQAH